MKPADDAGLPAAPSKRSARTAPAKGQTEGSGDAQAFGDADDDDWLRDMPQGGRL